jgi:hypothetical protein
MGGVYPKRVGAGNWFAIGLPETLSKIDVQVDAIEQRAGVLAQ